MKNKNGFTMNSRLLSIFVLSALGGSAWAATQPESTSKLTKALREKVQNVVVIYAENEGFDKLYGKFPGANGIPQGGDYIPQIDRNAEGAPLKTLPPTWGGVTENGQTPVITEGQSAGLPNAPFPIETGFIANGGSALSQSVITRDLYHRFFENQMQINGGKNDKFAAYADAGGLVMGYYDGSKMAMWKIAQQYVLADNFYQGAFGGSFLNHQYLICACLPEYPNADAASAKPSIAILDKDANGNYTHNLTIADKSPASAMDGPPKFARSGNIAPKNYFGDGTFRAVNTMQPPFQPSGNVPADATENNLLYADTSKATTLPVQTQQNIGDLLTAKHVSWAWYSGAWNAALKDGAQAPTGKRTLIYNDPVNFQPHHQPFNYYQAFDPVQHANARAEHLKDYDDLVADAANGKLPAVTFYKPEGDLNQHPGYASVTAGDQHIAGLIAKLQHSPQWKHMVIVVTYDENGGAWDHAAPPKGDLVGPGTRIPAIIVSPFAKKGTVDHTQYDTASVLRLVTRRFGLPKLPGLELRDRALMANGAPAMGDLTNALKLN